MAGYMPYAPYTGQFGAQPYQPNVFQAQQTQPVIPQPQGSMVKLVTSRDEVVATQIPFDGSVSYFCDTSNGKIYTKTFDPMTGTAPIVTYVRETEAPVHYATMEDLNKLADALRTELKPKRKAAKNDDADE